MSHSRRNFLQATAVSTVALAAGAPLLAGVSRKPALSLSKSADFDFLSPNAELAPPKPAFPVHDYHVHLSNTLTIDQAVQLGKERGVEVGIVEHPGPGFPLNTDAELQRYIDGLRPYPVRIG